MRILRIRRGFTTNSSGANEYMPKPREGGIARLDAKKLSDGGVARADQGKPGPAPPAARDALAAIPPPPPPAGACGWSGTEILVELGVGVVLVFVLDRVLRGVIRRRRDRSGAPPDDGSGG